jgi:hypothetical protein
LILIVLLWAEIQTSKGDGTMKLRAQIFACLALGVGLSGVAGIAQDDKKAAQTVKPDLPGAIHGRLAELAGSWDVTIKYVIANKEHEGKASCEAKMILDGRFLQQDYSSNFQGRPFQVLQLWGFDNVKKKSIEMMMDTMGTGAHYNEGTVTDDGKEMTNAGESRDPSTGKPYRLRTVTTFVDRDHFVTEWFGTPDGGKESKTVTLNHTRKRG